MPHYSLDTTPEKLRAFANTDFDGPFIMLNMLRFKDVASYPKDHPNFGISGPDAYKIYMQQTGPIITPLKAEMIMSGQAVASPIAPEGEAWDKIFMIRWPSKGAFFQMLKSEEYQKIVHHRMAALLDSRLIAIVEDT